MQNLKTLAAIAVVAAATSARADIYGFEVTSEINFIDDSNPAFPVALAGTVIGDTVRALGTFDSDAVGVAPPLGIDPNYTQFPLLSFEYEINGVIFNDWGAGDLVLFVANDVTNDGSFDTLLATNFQFLGTYGFQTGNTILSDTTIDAEVPPTATVPGLYTSTLLYRTDGDTFDTLISTSFQSSSDWIVGAVPAPAALPAGLAMIMLAATRRRGRRLRIGA